MSFSFISIAAVSQVGCPTSEPALALSRWARSTAVEVVDMETSLKRRRDVSGQTIVLIIAETFFLAAVTLIGLLYPM